LLRYGRDIDMDMMHTGTTSFLQAATLMRVRAMAMMDTAMMITGMSTMATGTRSMARAPVHMMTDAVIAMAMMDMGTRNMDMKAMARASAMTDMGTKNMAAAIAVMITGTRSSHEGHEGHK